MVLKKAARTALVTVVAIAVPATFAQQSLASCSAADDVQFIIDDSFSMTEYDPAGLRVEAVKMLITKETNKDKYASAIEFHAWADEIFPPSIISTKLAEMLSKLDSAITSNGGGTNYNSAWELANSVGALAKARVFLTDGIPTEGGDYENGHRGLDIPVYVVGFGDSGNEGNSKLLALIASETKGKYFKETTSNSLTAAVNEIDAVINCRSKPRTYNDNYQTGKKKPSHVVPLAKKTKMVDVVVSWSSPAQSFDIASIQVLKGKKVVGTAAASKLEVTKSSGKTYVSAQVTNIKRGNSFRYSIKAKKLSGKKVKVTSQVSQGR